MGSEIEALKLRVLATFVRRISWVPILRGTLCVVLDSENQAKFGSALS